MQYRDEEETDIERTTTGKFFIFYFLLFFIFIFLDLGMGLKYELVLRNLVGLILI